MVLHVDARKNPIASLCSGLMLYNGPLLYSFNVPIKGLNFRLI